MGGYREGDIPSERVEIHGKWYYVCAECRRPMLMGHSTIYDVPRPEKGLPGSQDPAQALCNPCYRAQYKRIYPKAAPIPPQSEAFNPVEGEAPIPWDKTDWRPRPKTDIELLEEALMRAKAGGGAETPEEILRQLRGEHQKSAEVTLA